MVLYNLYLDFPIPFSKMREVCNNAFNTSTMSLLEDLPDTSQMLLIIISHYLNRTKENKISREKALDIFRKVKFKNHCDLLDCNTIFQNQLDILTSHGLIDLGTNRKKSSIQCYCSKDDIDALISSNTLLQAITSDDKF